MSGRTALEIADRLCGLQWPLLVEAADVLRAQHAEIKRLRRQCAHIYDLLARIHRDGGQHTAEHGIEKACDDAEAQVVTLIDTIASIDALCEQARIAERAACELAVDNERVKSVSESDDVYNTAIDHALAAIRERTKK